MSGFSERMNTVVTSTNMMEEIYRTLTKEVSFAVHRDGIRPRSGVNI